MGLGTTLRLVGYLVEVACLIGLFQARSRAEAAPGAAVEGLLYLGIVAGAGLIVAGNIVNARTRRAVDRKDVPRDSP
jgi:hypothetical protein